MNELGLVYFHIYEKLKVKALPDGSMTRKEIYHCLGKNYHIPKEMKGAIFMELESAGLIKSKARGIVIINRKANIRKLIDKRVIKIKKSS